MHPCGRNENRKLKLARAKCELNAISRGIIGYEKRLAQTRARKKNRGLAARAKQFRSATKHETRRDALLVPVPDAKTRLIQPGIDPAKGRVGRCKRLPQLDAD